MRAILLLATVFIGYSVYANWYKFRPIYGKPFKPKLYNVNTGEEIVPKPVTPSFNQYTDSYGQTIATY